MRLFSFENPFKSSRHSRIPVEDHGRDSLDENDWGLANRRWYPHTDLFEAEAEYLLKADLPGVRKNDLRIIRSDGELVITGHRELACDAGQKPLRLERPRGDFVCRIEFPADAGLNSIGARLADGVLEVRLPKISAAK